MRNHTLMLIMLYLLISKDTVFAQNSTTSFNGGTLQLSPLSHTFNGYYYKQIYGLGSNMHSAVQPYLMSDIDSNNADSITNAIFKTKKHTKALGRKVFEQHLFQINTKDYGLYLDFLPDWQLGKQNMPVSQNLFLNTRGFAFGGNIGKKFAFYSDFYENQANFPKYLDSFGRVQKVIPGQGVARNSGDFGTDFASANGYILYRPSQYFYLQAGNTKHFIGDGYRSMLLSDNQYPYPSLKLSTRIWKIQYTNIYSAFQNIYDLSKRNGDQLFARHYGTFHHLDLAIGRRWKIGIFETIIFRDGDSTGRGFDINYLNPIIFFRPVEYSIGSPDNALIGANASYKINNNSMAYGQFLLDEFKAAEYKNNTGWWANKLAYQVGIKIFEPLKIKNLFLQGEYNQATPYTYSHNYPLQSYGHYNQPLAHPLGANFKEYIGIIRYNIGKIQISLQANYAKYGRDNDTSNVGKNIFLSNSTRDKDYGNKIGQGIATTLQYNEIRVAYLLNPRTNLRLETWAVMRKENGNLNTFVNIGLRASFRNMYYDF